MVVILYVYVFNFSLFSLAKTIAENKENVTPAVLETPARATSDTNKQPAAKRRSRALSVAGIEICSHFHMHLFIRYCLLFHRILYFIIRPSTELPNTNGSSQAAKPHKINVRLVYR